MPSALWAVAPLAMWRSPGVNFKANCLGEWILGFLTAALAMSCWIEIQIGILSSTVPFSQKRLTAFNLGPGLSRTTSAQVLKGVVQDASGQVPSHRHMEHSKEDVDHISGISLFVFFYLYTSFLSPKQPLAVCSTL